MSRACLGGRGLGLMGGRWIGRRCFSLEAFFQKCCERGGGCFFEFWVIFFGLVGIYRFNGCSCQGAPAG